MELFFLSLGLALGLVLPRIFRWLVPTRRFDRPTAWELPSSILDSRSSPAKAPRRSFREVLAGFMEQRTTTTIIALLGLVVMIAAAFQAWPDPMLFSLVCLVHFAVLTFVAFRYRLPIAHAAALPFLALGYVVLWHLGLQALTEAHVFGGSLTFAIFTSARSGVALVGLFLLLGIAAEVLVRRGLWVHAVSYALGGGVVALCSLLFVSFRAIRDPTPAMAIYAIYGISALVMNLRWRRPLITCVGLALLTGSTLWALHGRHVGVNSWGTVLALEALVLGLLAAVLGRRQLQLERLRETYREPLARSGEALSLLAVLTALTAGIALKSWAFEHVVTSACLVVFFLILAAIEGRVGMARLAGLMLIGGVVAGAGWAVSMTGEIRLAGQLPAIGLWTAVAGCFMAAVATKTKSEEPNSKNQSPGLEFGSSALLPWYRILPAWREIAVLAMTLGGVVTLAGLPNWGSLLPFYSGLFLAATAFILVWEYQSASWTWIGSAFVLGSIEYALARRYPRGEFLTPSSLALLCHATAALIAGLVLKNRFQASRRLVAEPLSRVALVSSFLALPMLVSVPAGTMFSCLGLGWLAALWLVSWVEKRRPAWFTACQAVLVMVVLFGTTAWLESQTWFTNYSGGDRFVDPRSLQAYGIGLAAFCFVCMLGRIRARSVSEGSNPSITIQARTHLIPDSGFAVDHVVLAGLVIGQAALAVLGVLPGAIHELFGVRAAEQTMIWAGDKVPLVFGPGAWMMWGLMAVVLVAGLWEKQASRCLIGLTIAAATLPILAAGPYDEQLATASALRWGQAIAFLACSVLVCSRAPLYRQTVKVGCQLKAGTSLPEIVGRVLLVLTATPVLLLTGIVAYVGFVSGSPPKPGIGSLFDQMGWVANHVVPPIVVSLVLAAYALRERSPAHAFAGGLIISLTIMGGYALGVVADGGHLGFAEWVRAIQLGTIAAGIWAIGWLLLHFWLPQVSLNPGEPGASATGDDVHRPPILSRQVALCLAGNAVLWAAASALLWLRPENPSLILPFGKTLGWLAWLVSGAGALLCWRRTSASSVIHVLAGFALASGILAASWASRWDLSGRWLAYHVLMLAWTLIAMLLLLAWRRAETAKRRSGETVIENLPSSSDSPFLRFPASLSHSFNYAMVSWLEGIGILVLVLAIGGAWSDPQRPYWSAGAALAISATCGGLVLWLRRPLNVYASGFAMNLAGTMIWVVAGDQRWERLVYVNILSLAMGFLAWTVLDLWLTRKAPPVSVRRGWLPARRRHPPRCG